jgi:hypothetical protein
MDQTNRHSTPPKTPPVPQHLLVLPNTCYERMEQEETHLSAREYPGSTHYIELSIVQKLDLVKYWTSPTAIAPHPRPRQYSNIYVF